MNISTLMMMMTVMKVLLVMMLEVIFTDFDLGQQLFSAPPKNCNYKLSATGVSELFPPTVMCQLCEAFLRIALSINFYVIFWHLFPLQMTLAIHPPNSSTIFVSDKRQLRNPNSSNGISIQPMLATAVAASVVA